MTVSSDEPLIIATLLDLDLGRILAFDPPERMNALWRPIGTSPLGVDGRILFRQGPTLHQRGLRRAPQSLLVPDPPHLFSLSGDTDHPGFLDEYCNPRGLVVELSGFRVNIARPAKGLHRHLIWFDSLPRDDAQGKILYSRDCEGRWYILQSEQSASMEAPWVVLSGLAKAWGLYRGSSLLVPENNKAHLGLLVEEADEQHPHSNDFMDVEIQSHVIFCSLGTELSQECELAYCLVQQLASSPAARHLEDLAAALTDIHSPSYYEALLNGDKEIQRLARSPFAMEALTASGNSADERGSVGIGEWMERIYRGLYVQVEEYAPCNRKWCVD